MIRRLSILLLLLICAILPGSSQFITLDGAFYSDGFLSASVCKENNRILANSYEKPPALWNCQTRKKIVEFKLGKIRHKFICLSPDEKSLYTIPDSGGDTLYMWNAADGSFRHKYYLISFTFPPIFSPDSKKLLTRNFMEHDFIIRNVETGNIESHLKHDSQVEDGVFSPDGSLVATASWDQTAKLWDANSGALLYGFKHSSTVSRVCFSPDGNVLLCICTKHATLWNTKNGQLLTDLEIPYVDEGCFSPDGTKIMTECYDNFGVRIFDSRTFELLFTFYPGEHTAFEAFSPDGSVMLTKEVSGNTAKIWSAADGKMIAELIGHTNIISSFQFSPDSKKIVTASWDNKAKVWDAKNGTFLFDLNGHKDKVNTVRFSQDGSLIVTSSWDNTVRVWDASTGKKISKISGK